MASSSSDPTQGVAPKKELQGQRPAPLKVGKDSHGIRKPPVPLRKRQSPVIIYLRSPKIIHTKAHEFMALVQRLTGKSPSASSSSLPPLPSAPSAAATMIPATSLPYFTSPAIDGIQIDSGISQETVIDIEPYLSDDIIIDAKPTQMLPPNGVLSPAPSFLSQPSPNFFLPSPKASLPSPNLLELSPFLYTPSYQDAVFLSPWQRPWGSMAPLSSTPASPFLDAFNLSDWCRRL